MNTQLTVIKVGGQVVENPESLNALLESFKAVEGSKVLVHGGGKSATKMAANLGIETKMVDGRRITDAEMLKVVTMVYAGLVNKNIVAQLQSKGINALGLTGADMNVILAHKRTGTAVDYGFVGDVDKADGKMLSLIIEQGIVPVMSPITHNGQGQLLNTNADTIAAETAKSLVPFADVRLVYCFEKKGVLSNPDDENSVIPVICKSEFQSLIDNGTVSAGMIPKLQNAFQAIDAGVKEVVICNSSIKGGTVIKK